MNDAQLQVMTDHLREVEEPEDAEEMARWLKYPGAVRLLFGSRMCRCDIYMGCHAANCWTVEAMRVLKHKGYERARARQLQFVEHDWNRALEEEASRRLTPEERAEANHRSAVLVTTFLHGVISSPLGIDGGDIVEVVPGSDREMYLQQDERVENDTQVDTEEREATRRRLPPCPGGIDCPTTGPCPDHG